MEITVNDFFKFSKSLGSFAAKRILPAIDTKLAQGPLEFGDPLTGNLVSLRKLRVGDYRVVYQVTNHQVVVYDLAVGPRRDKEIYAAVGKWT